MFFPESRLASCGTVIYAMACPITHFDLTCPIYIKTHSAHAELHLIYIMEESRR